MSCEEPTYRSESFVAIAMDTWGVTVYRLALAQTTSTSDAEDIYQEVFIRLFKDQTSFSSHEHIKAWLIRVTVNCCRDLARTRWVQTTAPLESAGEHAVLDKALDGAAEDLMAALRTLNENQRSVIHLYYYEGYSTEDIARLLGIDASTVRSRMQRARMKLKQHLGGVSYAREASLSTHNGLHPTTGLAQE